MMFLNEGLINLFINLFMILCCFLVFCLVFGLGGFGKIIDFVKVICCVRGVWDGMVE